MCVNTASIVTLLFISLNYGDGFQVERNASKYCVLDVDHNNFRYIATTQEADGYPVFQGFNASCKPQEFYLKHNTAENGRREWYYNTDFNAEYGDRKGFVHPHFTICPDHSTVYDIAATHAANIHMSDLSLCLYKTVNPLELDPFSNIIFGVTGYETYTLLPTLEKTPEGYTVYQGYTDDCAPINRYLVHRAGVDEWSWRLDPVNGANKSLPSISKISRTNGDLEELVSLFDDGTD
eukprot:Lankesteria_metandrocarpae@DN7501_c0_g1_i1.p1